MPDAPPSRKRRRDNLQNSPRPRIGTDAEDAANRVQAAFIMDKPTSGERRPVERRRQWVRIAAFVLFLAVIGAVVFVVGEVSWKDHLINWQTSSQSKETRHGQTGG